MAIDPNDRQLVTRDGDGYLKVGDIGSGTATGATVTLTGFTAGAAEPLAASDTVNEALAKIEARLDALEGA